MAASLAASCPPCLRLREADGFDRSGVQKQLTSPLAVEQDPDSMSQASTAIGAIDSMSQGSSAAEDDLCSRSSSMSDDDMPGPADELDDMIFSFDEEACAEVEAKFIEHMDLHTCDVG